MKHMVFNEFCQKSDWHGRVRANAFWVEVIVCSKRYGTVSFDLNVNDSRRATECNL